MPTPANLRPSPLGAPCWHKTLVVAVLLAAAACADVADTPSTPRSTQPPPTPTGTGVTVPAFDRGRFAAVIPLPGAGCVTVADGVLWVLDASGTVVRIDPATNAAVGEPLRVPAHAEAIAVGDGRCGSPASPQGISAPCEDAVTRIDLATSRTVATITVRRAPWTSRPPRGPSG